ncbi:uncharacterized protein LOC127843819 isoform X2 [Dreissena polymorpha]|nr:uncharacterized protein LOC127843819 isoform X2 [Dreissena polymorpha]XP_052229617.1 uncharacterized protein LOC127843819 isoform X2 [Dreissena polymorpha]KAH3775742.1 hypothetical protein DPMN_177148 [Dreissena polymorpha]
MMSDTDTLTYSENDVACVHLSDCQDSKKNYLVIKGPMSLPQCCCLQLVVRLQNNKYLPMSRDLIYNTESIEKNRFIFDEQGRLLFNSKFYFNMFVISWDNLNLTRVQQHGPAFTYFNSDNVCAVRCLTLPDNCKVLFTRPRPGHWPKKGTLLKAEQCEVYMVHSGVQKHTFSYDDGHRCSFIKIQFQNTYVDSHFRVSTNMIERLLMFDLNIVQMKAYVLTKMIRKEFLQPLINERLSTFHMKTALLFTIEQFPEDIWRDNNLVQCVIYCLNTLRRFLKRGYCPHYTIASVNLFEGKLTAKDVQVVKENVTEMINSKLRCLRMLTMDDVGWRISASSTGLRNDNILSGSEIRFEIIKPMIHKLRLDYDEPILRTHNDLKMEALAIKSAMATDHEFKNEFEFMFHNMCINLASQEASDCIANGREVTSDIIDMYETSLRSNNISNHLRYASMLVSARKFERSCELLETIENMITPGMIQLTELSKQSIYVRPKSHQGSNTCTSTDILMEYAAHFIVPLVFVRNEINCVPGHLIYEHFRAFTDDEIKCDDLKVGNRYINHVFKSDVKPFLFYLQYISSKNKDKKRLALTKLFEYCMGELQNRTSDYLDTALNMLGYVVELENCLPVAWTVYRLSVAIQSPENAAYWHLFRLFGQVVYSTLC